MLYTRKGDTGTSGLFGTKERFPKNSPIYDALGTVDELNSLLGLCRARSAFEPDIVAALMHAQECLFIVQAELAGVEKSITQVHIDTLEHHIELFESKIENPHAFVIPGATEISALFDYARAVSRRAERSVLIVRDSHTIADTTIAYLNRLSSLLYALARCSAQQGTHKEISPTYI